MTKAYQILNWDSSFENERSRVVKRCSFVCLPNKIGMGLSRLLAHEDGAAMFGVFILMVEMCSRQQKPRKGWLTEDGRSDGRPYDADDIAVAIRRSSREVGRTLEVLASPKIGWLSLVDPECAGDKPVSILPHSSPVVPPSYPSDKERTNERRNERPPGADAAADGGVVDELEIDGSAEVVRAQPKTPKRHPAYVACVNEFALGSSLGPKNRDRLDAMLGAFGAEIVRAGLTEARANRATNPIPYADTVCNRLYAEKFQGPRAKAAIPRTPAKARLDL